MSLSNNKSQRCFKKRFFHIAVYLFASGLELVNIDDTSNPKCEEFVFHNTLQREVFVQNYNFVAEDAFVTSYEVSVYIKKPESFTELKKNWLVILFSSFLTFLFGLLKDYLMKKMGIK